MTIHTAPASQTGAVQLFVTLTLLLLLTLAGISAAVMSSTQFKLARNMQFENDAFNQAESAAAVGEAWLATDDHAEDAGFATYSTATPYLYPIGYLSSHGVDPLTMSWTNANSVAVNGDETRRYLIEKIGANNQPLGTEQNPGGRALSGCTKVDLYRVSARGTSTMGTTRLVQTTFMVPSC